MKSYLEVLIFFKEHNIGENVPISKDIAWDQGEAYIKYPVFKY